MEFIDLTEKKCFLIRCSDWSTIAEAITAEEACTVSLSKMLSIKGKSLRLSSVIISEELKADIYSEDYAYSKIKIIFDLYHRDASREETPAPAVSSPSPQLISNTGE